METPQSGQRPDGLGIFRLRDIQYKNGAIAVDPQENIRRIRRGELFARAGCKESGFERPILLPDREGLELPHGMNERARITQLCGDPLRINPAMARAIEVAAGKGHHGERISVLSAPLRLSRPAVADHPVPPDQRTRLPGARARYPGRPSPLP